MDNEGKCLKVGRLKSVVAIYIKHVRTIWSVFFPAEVCVHALISPVSLCIQIMTERKNAKAMAGGSLQDRIQAGLDLPLQGRFVCMCLQE